MDAAAAEGRDREGAGESGKAASRCPGVHRADAALDVAAVVGREARHTSTSQMSN